MNAKMYSKPKPSTNCGKLMPRNASPIVVRSHTLPGLSAAITPAGRPSSSSHNTPPSINSSVAGNLEISSSAMLALCLYERPRSPRKSFVRYSVYCVRNGLSKPNSRRMLLTVATLALGPAAIRAGSAGSSTPNAKVRKDTASSTNAPCTPRSSRNRITAPRGSSGSKGRAPRADPRPVS